MATPVGSFAPIQYPSPFGEDYGPGTAFQPGPYLPMGGYSPYQDPTYTGPKKPNQAIQYMAPIAGGFGAGSQTVATPSAGEGVMQTLGAGITGAATGAAVGGVPGAIVGGVVGTVTGGINAYMGLRRARAQKREAERVFKQMQEREDRRARQNRADMKEEQRYQRNQNAVQNQWTAMQFALQRFNDILARDDKMQAEFLQLGR